MENPLYLYGIRGNYPPLTYDPPQASPSQPLMTVEQKGHPSSSLGTEAGAEESFVYTVGLCLGIRGVRRGREGREVRGGRGGGGTEWEGVECKICL